MGGKEEALYIKFGANLCLASALHKEAHRKTNWAIWCLLTQLNSASEEWPQIQTAHGCQPCVCRHQSFGDEHKYLISQNCQVL